MASAESDRMNPAAIFGISRLMHISLIQYPADIQAKALTLIIPRKANTIALSLRHLGYGDFEQYDEDGNRLGDYISGDTWMTGSTAYGFQDNKFLVGVTGGFFISQLEDYQSIVLTLAAGIIYDIELIKMRLGLSLQNGGFVLTRYTSEKEKLPTALVASINKRVAHLPLELALDVAYQLSKETAYARFSGTFDLPHQFKLQWGFNTNKLYQQTGINYINDFFGSSGFGLAYDNQEYRFEFGGYFFTSGGWIVGMGMGIYF